MFFNNILTYLVSQIEVCHERQVCWNLVKEAAYEHSATVSKHSNFKSNLRAHQVLEVADPIT